VNDKSYARLSPPSRCRSSTPLIPASVKLQCSTTPVVRGPQAACRSPYRGRQDLPEAHVRWGRVRPGLIGLRCGCRTRRRAKAPRKAVRAERHSSGACEVLVVPRAATRSLGSGGTVREGGRMGRTETSAARERKDSRRRHGFWLQRKNPITGNRSPPAVPASFGAGTSARNHGTRLMHIRRLRRRSSKISRRGVGLIAMFVGFVLLISIMPLRRKEALSPAALLWRSLSARASASLPVIGRYVRAFGPDVVWSTAALTTGLGMFALAADTVYATAGWTCSRFQGIFMIAAPGPGRASA